MFWLTVEGLGAPCHQGPFTVSWGHGWKKDTALQKSQPLSLEQNCVLEVLYCVGSLQTLRNCLLFVTLSTQAISDSNWIMSKGMTDGEFSL